MFENFFASVDCFFRGLMGRFTEPPFQSLPEGAKVFKRSNYSRIEHKRYSWGFMPAVEGNDILLRTHPQPNGLCRVFCAKTEQVYTPAELRTIAYTFLAAANSIDGRHNKARRTATRKRIPETVA